MKEPKLIKKNRIRPFQYLNEVISLRRLRSDADFWETMKPVFENSMSTGCDFSELLRIHNYIKKVKPTSILELGSGVSTAVICHAIHSLQGEGYKCNFTSLEESPDYHEQLQKIFPSNLKGYVEMICSETVDREIKGGYISRVYKDKPINRYDFVFIDGPQVPKSRNYLDGDILDVMEWNDGPIVAFLDQRVHTRRALRKLIPSATVRGGKDFTVFHIPELKFR